MHLPDPRLYPRPNARNPAIRQVMARLTADTHAAAQTADQSLRETLTDMLLANDHAGLNAALTQSPALEAAQALWQTLREVVETIPLDGIDHAVPFLIPVVLVAGVKGEATLPGTLSDPQAIITLLHEHGLIAPSATVHLHAALVTADSLGAVSPSRLLRWRDEAQIATSGLPLDLAAAPVAFRDEGVYLRFIVGTALHQAGQTAPIQLNARIGAWGLKLAEAIGTQLATPGVTLFTIPRAPQSWLSALESSRTTLMETRLQHMASNAIRGIRLKNRTPVAMIAAHENHEIRITVSSIEDGERWNGFVWELGPRDEVGHIQQFAEDLFRECRVDDIRIVPNVQPDMQGDLPFFATAHYLPLNPQ